ncbi:diablo IAP-binding mitochondrial protein-like [Argopecten irradians]|uniref:diablo IAP-binding mitochondrial protein-like n=1 Tax=Argopecten irradians TaxID=31199 RepID=UPI0037197BA4
MASTCFRFTCNRVRNLLQRKAIFPYGNYRRPTPKIFFLASFVALCSDNEQRKSSLTVEKLKSPDPSTLTTEYLLRNASLTSLDSTLRLLSVTTVALSDIEKEYARWTFVLIKFMKFRLTVLDKPKEEEHVWDMILQTRHKLSELKERRRDLTLLYQTVVTMVSSAAEAALISGVEYQVSSANEAMQSSQMYLRGVQEASLEAEKEMTDIQVETIAKESKHAEEEEKKSQGTEKEDLIQKEGTEERKGKEKLQETDAMESSVVSEDILKEIKMHDLDRLTKNNYATFVDDEGENCTDSSESDVIFNENIEVDADDNATEKEIFQEEIKKDKFDPDQWKES